MDKDRKDLLIKNLQKINNYIPYLDKLISYYCFNNRMLFNSRSENDFNVLYEYLDELETKFEVKKIDEKLFVPIYKPKNKKIHSIYEPTKEAIKVDQENDVGNNIINKYVNDSGICYEIFGIGFLYSLYGLKTGSKIKFVLIDESIDLFLLSCCYLDIAKIFEDNNVNIYIKGCLNDSSLKVYLSYFFMQVYNPLNTEKIIRKENLNCFLESNIKDVIDEWEDFRKDVIFNIKTYTINFALELKNAIGNISYLIQKIKERNFNENNLIKIFEKDNEIKNKEIYKKLFSKNQDNEKIRKNEENKVKKGKKETKGKAIIIGASPSLDDDKIKLNLLKKIKDNNPFIIAVDNAINFCIINDILPDLIVILDNRNIISLMVNRYFEKLRKIPILLPISASKKIICRFENPIIFNYPYFQDLPDFLFYIIKNNIKNKKNLNFSDIELLIKNLFLNLPVIEIPVKNVGAFSYLLAKEFGFSHIETFGIDFSLKEKKYYYKYSYFYDFYNSKQNYLNTTIGISTKISIRKGEKYLFEKYKNEFNEIDNIKIKIDFFNSDDEKDFSIQKYYDNLLTYFYIKSTDKKKSELSFNLFLEKIIQLLNC